MIFALRPAGDARRAQRYRKTAMRQEAKIVLHDGRLMAEVVRTEACQQCRACNFGQQERVYIDTGALECREGDSVYIDIDDGSVSRASVFAYGVPVAALLAGLAVGAVITDTDYLQAACAFAGLVLGLCAVKLIEKRAKRTGKYSPKVKLSPKTDDT